MGLESFALPNLFPQPKQRKRAYWQFIELVAPSADADRVWKAKDATAAYCKKCRVYIRWTIGESAAVKRHMESVHNHDLEAYDRKLRSIQENFDGNTNFNSRLLQR